MREAIGPQVRLVRACLAVRQALVVCVLGDGEVAILSRHGPPRRRPTLCRRRASPPRARAQAPRPPQAGFLAPPPQTGEVVGGPAPVRLAPAQAQGVAVGATRPRRPASKAGQGCRFVRRVRAGPAAAEGRALKARPVHAEVAPVHGRRHEHLVAEVVGHVVPRAKPPVVAPRGGGPRPGLAEEGVAC